MKVFIQVVTFHKHLVRFKLLQAHSVLLRVVKSFMVCPSYFCKLHMQPQSTLYEFNFSIIKSLKFHNSALLELFDRKFSSLTYGYNLDNFFTFMILMRRSMHLVLICNLHLCRSSRVAYWLSYGAFSKLWHIQCVRRPGQASERIRPSCNVSRSDCASLIIWPVLGIFVHFICLALTLTK